MVMPVPPGAHNFVVNVQGDLIDNSPTCKIGSGLRVLLEASYPEATHDSSSHPTSCLLGTRLQYIEDITGWALALASERHFHIMWMEGPAGVGKSSLAQSCTEEVGAKLAAAFFFSRPNNRHDPSRLFPSIAYQLTTKHPGYHDKLNKKISYDPSIVKKSLNVQFRELLVIPLRELQQEGQSLEGGVVFVDGLDECAGEDAQCTIIDIICASVREKTTPFVWALFSRPEPRIVSHFTAPDVNLLCWHIMLPVSHDADGDVQLYLEDGFRKIRIQYGFPSMMSWPSKDAIQEIVRRSEGLFVYPTSVIRFVGDGGPLGPEEQLRLILDLPSKLTGNPWSHLDAFYTLIMRGIAKDMAPNALKLLSLACLQYAEARVYEVAAEVLCLSLPTYCATLSKLHSVVELTYTGTGSPKNLQFYHASFTDFLLNPERSGRFCVKTPETCASLLTDVIKFFDKSPGGKGDYVAFIAFWKLGSYAKLDENLLRQLSRCDYRNMPELCTIAVEDPQRFFNNIPAAWRKEIMHSYSLSLRQKLFGRKNPIKIVFVLGQGNRKRGLANANFPGGHGPGYRLCYLPEAC